MVRGSRLDTAMTMCVAVAGCRPSRGSGWRHRRSCWHTVLCWRRSWAPPSWRGLDWRGNSAAWGRPTRAWISAALGSPASTRWPEPNMHRNAATHLQVHTHASVPGQWAKQDLELHSRMHYPLELQTHLNRTAGQLRGIYSRFLIVFYNRVSNRNSHRARRGRLISNGFK